MKNKQSQIVQQFKNEVSQDGSFSELKKATRRSIAVLMLIVFIAIAYLVWKNGSIIEQDIRRFFDDNNISVEFMIIYGGGALVGIAGIFAAVYFFYKAGLSLKPNSKSHTF